MAIPVLNPEEFQYTDAGFLMNGSSAVPFTDINKISGMDSVDLRQSSHDREGLDGGYLDASFEGMRTVVLEGVLYANVFALETVVDTLKANYAPSALAQPLYFGTDAGVRVTYGKALGFKYDKDTLRRTGSCNFQTSIVCEDPRLYDPNIISATVTLASSVITGRSYNKSYTYGYGPSSSSTSLTLVLAGNRTLPGNIRVYGPIINPTVTNNNNGAQFILNLNIANGDYVEINLNNRTVKLNSVLGVRNKMTIVGAWYLLNPGANNFSLAGSATLSGTTKLVISANAAAWR